MMLRLHSLSTASLSGGQIPGLWPSVLECKVEIYRVANSVLAQLLLVHKGVTTIVLGGKLVAHYEAKAVGRVVALDDTRVGFPVEFTLEAELALQAPLFTCV